MSLAVVPHDIVSVLGWTLLHSLWQIAALAWLYRLVRAPLARYPQKAHGSIVGLLLVGVVGMAATAAWLSLSRVPIAFDQGEVVGKGSSATHTAQSLTTGVAPPPDPWADAAAAVVERGLWLVVGLWALGGVLAVARVAVALCRWARIAERARTVEAPALLSRYTRLKRRLAIDRDVMVLASAEVDGPMLVRTPEPAILLPAATVGSLPEAEIEALLAHELAHVGRRDLEMQSVLNALTGLLFFNPFWRWLVRELGDTRELCCDELAARVCRGGSLGYARGLLALEERRATPLAVLGATDGSLKGRIERLLSNDSPARASTVDRGSLTSSLLAATGAVVCVAFGVQGLVASRAAVTVLGGLDPVHLVEGVETSGSPRISLHSSGYRYLFADVSSRDRFLASPERYLVRNAESCPVTGDPVHPEIWRVIHGRLVLFCCPRAYGIPEHRFRERPEPEVSSVKPFDASPNATLGS